MSAHLDTTYATLLVLVADPFACYRETTATLEQCLARTQGLTHGRRAPDPMLAAVELLRHEITATLETRRRLDAQAASKAAQAASADRPQIDGGTRVPTNPPRPGPLPPARLPEPVDVL